MFLESMAIHVFGFKIKITVEHILLPSEKLKNTPEERRKTWFAILNSYKTTIYSLYYLRPAAIFCTEIADNLFREIVVPVGLLRVLGLWRGCTIGDIAQYYISLYLGWEI